jgi:hypothetical protein
MLKWLRTHPSVATVLGINVGWTLIAAASTEARPWGPWLWRGDGSPVEVFELVLLLVYIPTWAWIAIRLRRSDTRSRRWILAALMVVQLLVLFAEELDWGDALAPFRNLRQVLHLVLPQVLDSPAVSAYLLAFLFAPLVPLARVQSWLMERAAPVRAERDDAWATLAAPLCSLVVWPLVGDQSLGELHQLGVYAVLGIVTARVARRTAAA